MFPLFPHLLAMKWWDWMPWSSFFECWVISLWVSEWSRSVVSDSLRPHELQHARPPCPSPTPKVHSDSNMFMANRWGNNGNSERRYFGGSKITADVVCSHEIKRCLLLGRKATTKLDSILKSRDITLPTRICLVKAMVFPLVMYGCESWTIKKAERQRIDAFELCVGEDSWESLGLQGDPTSPS